MAHMDERHEVDTQTQPFRHTINWWTWTKMLLMVQFFLFYFLVVGGFLFGLFFVGSVWAISCVPRGISMRCNICANNSFRFLSVFTLCFFPFRCFFFAPFCKSPKTDFNVLFIFVSSPNFLFTLVVLVICITAGELHDQFTRSLRYTNWLYILFIGRMIAIGPHIFRGSIGISASGHGGIQIFQRRHLSLFESSGSLTFVKGNEGIINTGT